MESRFPFVFYYNVYYGGNNDWTDVENGAPGLAPDMRLRIAIGYNY
jgi:hypothetical protein